MKVLKCRDVVGDCDDMLFGTTEEDVMRAAHEHAKKSHGFSELPPAVAEACRQLIKDGEDLES